MVKRFLNQKLENRNAENGNIQQLRAPKVIERIKVATTALHEKQAQDAQLTRATKSPQNYIIKQLNQNKQEGPEPTYPS